jgi:hypothetical protein
MEERFTPDEIKQLVQSGELQMDDLKLLHPADAKVALGIMSSQKADDIPNAKLGAMPGPPVGKLASALSGGAKPPSGPPNVEKVSRAEFDQIGKPAPSGTSGNVTKASPTESISGGDRITQILFGGASAVGSKYPPVKKPPMGPQDILQMIQNMKEVSRAGLTGVTRRSPK